MQVLFQNVPEEHRHYAYGANCFQHAMGYPHPIIMREMYKGFAKLSYIGLVPGSIRHFDRKDSKGTKEVILSGCAEEGFVDCGDKFLQRADYRTIALFFRDKPEDADFHFAFMNDAGQWESQIALRGIAKGSLTTASMGYKFDRYLLAPKGETLKAISELNPTKVKLYTSQGKEVEVMEVDAKTSSDFLRVHEVLVKPGSDIAVQVQTKTLLAAPPIASEPLPFDFKSLKLGGQGLTTFKIT